MTGKIQWKILSRKVRKQKKMFYFEKCREIYSAILRLYVENTRVDLFTLNIETQKEMTKYLAELIDLAPLDTHDQRSVFDQCIFTIRDKFIRRKLIKVSNMFMRMAFDLSIPAGDLSINYSAVMSQIKSFIESR